MSNAKFIIGGRYEIKAIIGQGGMADVYLANDMILDREVAVKVLRENLADDPIYVQRFEREANAVATLSNKNIVEIYDVGNENNRHYIVMEYVAGQTLKELTYKRGALHMAEAIDIMKQVVNGVKAAHECGIIHRDLKPQNILVTNGGIVKIADFGIASISSVAQVTKTDTIMGSLHYLAPEIARGEKATPQSDIYALGIMFYELLVGQVPFNGDAPVNIALKHMQEEIPSVREINPTIYQSVENIIIKATAKNVENRYANASLMYNDLMHALENKDEEKIVFDLPEDEETTIVVNNDELFKQKDTPSKEEQQKAKRKKQLKLLMYGGMVAASIIIIIVLAFASGVFSKKIEKVIIPESIIGQNYEDAIEQLQNLKLEVSDKIIYQTSDKYEKDEVISVSPSTGKEVNINTTVLLTVSKGANIIIENYVGKNIDQVKKELTDLGIVVSVKKVESDKTKDTIVYQSISEGTTIEPGTPSISIEFEVSSAYSEKVPDVKGLNIYIAKTNLESLGFQVKLEVLPAPTNEDEIKAMSINTVISQSIEANKVIEEKGKQIILYYYDSKPEIKESEEEDDSQSTNKPEDGNNQGNTNQDNQSTNTPTS